MLGILLAGILLSAPVPSSPAAERASERATNTEMTSIFAADQKARQGDIDWAVVGPEDEARRARTQALLDAGALRSGDDFFHAAFVFQHGGTSDDYLKAHLLAIIATARGSAGATWIAAATLDRYLQSTGKPQILGTQFHVGPDGRATQEPFDRSIASDALRNALAVPALAAQEERRKLYETAAKPAPSSIPKLVLQHLAPSFPARTFAAKLQPAECRPIPGSEALLKRPNLRWIVIGELPGTNETPEIFGDLVCLGSVSQPVTVAVEQATSEQRAIDDFIGSDGGADATIRFFKSAIWTQPFKDGRSSKAYFKLFQRLRELREAGRITAVIAFQPMYNPGPAGFNAGDYENALAAALISRVPQNERVMVLVGNRHAMRSPQTWAKPPYMPMAGYLPVDTSVTLDARWNGGAHWACTSETQCGPQTVAPPATKSMRGISLDVENGSYTGALNLGVEATASPPQP